MLFRNPLLILDRDGRIIAVFVGAPEDPEWPEVVSKAMAALDEARRDGIRTGAFDDGDEFHRRGLFLKVGGGVSYGGGQRRPGNLVNPPLVAQLFNRLRENPYVRRLCGFQSSALRTFGPEIFDDYVTTLGALFDHHPGLQHNFTNSVFPAITFNLGPQSVTFEHADELNNPLGLCAVTNGGDFDPRKSAHLYLKQLKLVVEFPPGATSLIPSAVVDHGNTPLAANETRYSITQYAAGGLFRWVKYGFRTAKQLLSQPGGRALKASIDGTPGQRHGEGVGLFSKVDHLLPGRFTK
ncbi:hypothetical protein C8R47DRAFT_974832 [Mycena vitilis]|nr:hypothetical protein C8R47DRAFT_985092 [Mycena vitilis]KAJ6488191.1 hypothetical protein C8R47DRAFT_978860 [Mycena vitilis]KAJ6493965.1 hypothetical protein C8R47DRAFT_974832 [Mycena vitilis]